jgi:transcriptional regulator with XRE-family HTH domain
MIHMETWPQYVRKVAGLRKQEEIAELTGLSQATVSAWLRGAPGIPRAETVIAFARAFSRSPVEALVAAGYLQSDEASVKARSPLSEYSSSELLDELRSRNPD